MDGIHKKSSALRQQIAGHGISIALPAKGRVQPMMAFSLRTGGYSPDPFTSLNFSTREGDSEENVHRNLRTLSDGLKIPHETIVFCKQVHGDGVRIIESIPVMASEADAMIATDPGLFPAIKTADCLPILLVDPKRRLSAAIHAGWKGTALRITRKVVLTMQRELGTEPKDLLAALGPAIGPCCYEVDETVLAPFRKNVPEADRFIVSLDQLKLNGNPPWTGENDKPLRTRRSASRSLRVDLAAANFFELTDFGVPPQNIHASIFCTACREDLFFSHRRDAGKTGRHIALVGFRHREC